MLGFQVHTQIHASGKFTSFSKQLLKMKSYLSSKFYLNKKSVLKHDYYGTCPDLQKHNNLKRSLALDLAYPRAHNTFHPQQLNLLITLEKLHGVRPVASLCRSTAYLWETHVIPADGKGPEILPKKYRILFVRPRIHNEPTKEFLFLEVRGKE